MVSRFKLLNGTLSCSLLKEPMVLYGVRMLNLKDIGTGSNLLKLTQLTSFNQLLPTNLSIRVRLKKITRDMFT